MSKQLFFERTVDELLHVVPLKEYLAQKILRGASVFHEPSLIRRWLITVVRGIVSIGEKISGTQWYVPNQLFELFEVDPRARRLIETLLEQSVIESWNKTRLLSDQPRIIHMSARLAQKSLSNNRLQGGKGEGVGFTLNEALIPALAETLERYSVAKWEEKVLVTGSYEALRRKGAVDPKLFLTLLSEHATSDLRMRCDVRDDTQLHWAKSTSLHGENCLVPAQRVFINYENQYRDEPIFSPSTTNGAAAGPNKNEAVYRALCEVIERDGLLLFWLNRIAPPRIAPETIVSEKAQHLLSEIRLHDLELHVLDITTDLKVPSFCAVIVDERGTVPIAMSAVADFDVHRALEKLLLEALKHLHGNSNLKQDLPHVPVADRPPNTLSERRQLWQSKEMIPNIRFFLKGKMKKLDIVDTTCADLPSKQKIQEITNYLDEHDYRGYIVDVTAKEARRAGLVVVKAIIPELIPFYLSEKGKGLRIQRTYTAPVAMGYREHPSTEAALNETPHPFL